MRRGIGLLVAWMLCVGTWAARPALLQQGRLWLPLRLVVETLGGDVVATGGYTLERVTLGMHTLTVHDGAWQVNGTPLSLSRPVRLLADTSYAPADFFTRGLGLTLATDLRAGRVTITDPATGATCRLFVQTTLVPPLTPQARRLFLAIDGNKVAVVRQLLVAQPGLVNARDAAGRTPMQHAIVVGNPALVTALLDAGDYPTGWDLYGAACNHNAPVIRLLLAHGARINAAPVLAAVLQQNALPLADELVARGARIEPAQVLEAAVCARFYLKTMDALDWVLDHGVDINASYGGRTALIQAMDYEGSGDRELVHYLLDHGANPNMAVGGWTPMHAVHDADTLRLLLEHGGDAAVTDDLGQTPLYQANEETAAVLLAHGALVDVRDHAERTPLHLAAASVFPAVAELELAHGAAVDARDRYGRTPLYYARDADMTALLLRHGADPNAADHDGNTPLHAVFYLPFVHSAPIGEFLEEDYQVDRDGRDADEIAGQAARVRLLLDAGADVNARNAAGNTPADLARAQGRTDLIAALIPPTR